MKTVVINKNDAEIKIDKFLKKYMPSAPSSVIYKALRKKRVKVNKKRCDSNYILKENDVLELYINDEFFEVTENSSDYMRVTPDLDIIYEDENIMLVNKKQGMIVHSDDKETFNTLINHILSYLRNKGEYTEENENTFRPALCNRIDRNTSGIVIAAKNAKTLKIINDKIKNNEISKYYLCIALGIFEKKSKTLKDYIVKDSDRNMVTVTKEKKNGAKEIITKYNVLKEKNNLSLVEVNLITGRTHQIRAHLSYIGHPILGDTKYAKLSDMPVKSRKQYLCSYKIEFNFKEDSDILNYLNGKSFEIKNPSIVKDFDKFSS